MPPDGRGNPFCHLDLQNPRAQGQLQNCVFDRIKPNYDFPHLRQIEIKIADREVHWQHFANILIHHIAGALDRHEIDHQFRVLGDQKAHFVVQHPQLIAVILLGQIEPDTGCERKGGDAKEHQTPQKWRQHQAQQTIGPPRGCGIMAWFVIITHR